MPEASSEWKLFYVVSGPNCIAVSPPVDMASAEACRQAKSQHRLRKCTGWLYAVNVRTGELI